MNTLFEASGFQVEITKDGSPTLKQQDFGESMHHSAGAAAETWYIYGSVLQTVFNKFVAKDSDQCIKICNVGLGLGYIEMAWTILTANKHTTLDSFEIIPELQTGLIDWISEKNSLPAEVYTKAAASLIAACITDTTMTIIDIKKRMQQQVQKSKLTFHNDVMKFNEIKKWNVICFDAFSRKTNSELWSPAFLNNFLDQFAADECVFTTYAATKSLKEALALHGFTEMNRPGFSGKRESTLAARGPAMIRAFQTF